MVTENSKRPDIARLTAAEYNIDPSSYVDPNGFVFHHKGKILRAIHSSVAPFYKTLFNDGLITRLIQNEKLVGTVVAQVELEGFPYGLVLEHARLHPLTYCVEWCPSMLRDAAQLHLDLCLELVDWDCVLQDAYPWNVLFDGARPVYIDFTSIVPADAHLIWPAYAQFLSFFLYPLRLARLGKGKVARSLMLNNIEGVTAGDFYTNADIRFKLRHPGLILERLMDRRIQSRPALKKKLKSMLAKSHIRPDRATRKLFFNKLAGEVKILRFADPGDAWRNYYADIPSDVDKEAKTSAVGTLIERLSPQSVLDLGCNMGVFSIIAARCGARVVAVDSSEACIESLYQTALEEGLRITPLVSDVLCPTPGFGFLGRQHPPLLDRVQSEVVLCLGLMHHLHFSGRQSFERIAKLVNQTSRKHLIFEFVALDDDNVALLQSGRKIDYDLDTVCSALSRYYPEIELIDSDRSTRKLLLCSK